MSIPKRCGPPTLNPLHRSLHACTQIGVDYPDHGPDGRGYIRSIPVRDLDELAPPFITCVSLDRTQGKFEANLRARNAREGVDYFTFS